LTTPHTLRSASAIGLGHEPLAHPHGATRAQTDVDGLLAEYATAGQEAEDTIVVGTGLDPRSLDLVGLL